MNVSYYIREDFNNIEYNNIVHLWLSLDNSLNECELYEEDKEITVKYKIHLEDRIIQLVDEHDQMEEERVKREDYEALVYEEALARLDV